MNNLERLQEMVLVMYSITLEDASLEEISTALSQVMAEEEYIAQYEAKRKTINWEDLLVDL